MSKATMRVELSVEEALSLLPEGDEVHTFRDSGMMLIGCDLGRRTVEKMIRESRAREIGGEMCRRMGHGLVIEDDGRWVFLAAVRERVDALESVKAPSPSESEAESRG